MYLFNEFRRGIEKDVIVTLGDTVAKRMKINMNTTNITPSQRDSPATDMIRYTADFVALASSSGDDEINLVFD